MFAWWFRTPEGRVQLTIVFVRVLLLAVAAFVSVVSIPPVNWPAFILALSGFYLGVVDPLLRRPRLELSLEHLAPLQTASLAPETRPALPRLKIANYGQSAARLCVGRLLELWSGDGQPVAGFSPQTLCWSHQRDPRDHSPVTIQGFGDCYYLDLAVYDQERDALVFRYTSESAASESAMVVPEIVFLRLGIYADGVRHTPTWWKITAQGQVIPSDPPGA